MIPELGNFALSVALGLSLLLAIFPAWGAIKQTQMYMNTARPLALGVFLFTLISYVCLSHAFLVDDFTLSYVANNSNSQLPWFYKLTAVWGSHEGSFLLWMLILSGWIGAVAIFSRGLTDKMRALVLAVMGAIYLAFDAFIISVSNPFERLLPYFPVDGRDLNPLLQDPGMIIHPPMLYMGYVGFSVAFAFAIAALINGKLDAAWARWSRPWTTAAWIFLTLGIALGSWWAYYELGWGGWWMWDPVENASFMPWLVGTGLIHSLAVTEKRGVFKAWTVFLAIAAFSLSLLGTFLVRSGVLVSVHAFASDPARGLFILAILVFVIGGSLTLFAWRAAEVRSIARYKAFSREVMLLANNAFLVTATIVVLLGTLFPLVHKELGLGSISIGTPFFNQLFTLLAVPFALLLGVGPMVRWKQQKLDPLTRQLLLGLAFAILLGGLTPVVLYGELKFGAALGLALGLWVLAMAAAELKLRATSVKGLTKLTASHWGMVLGHVGFAVTVMGIAVTSYYSEERDVRMHPGESLTLGQYEFLFERVKPVVGPNYRGHVADIQVLEEGEPVAKLGAEKRFYNVQSSVMTEAAIDATLGRDLYVALGEQLEDGSWAMRVYMKPMVRWIWLGAILMSLGGLLAMADKRYRRGRQEAQA